MNQKLSQATLVFVDVETTGLSPACGDRVCEISLIRQEPGTTCCEWSTLIDPQRPLSPGAFAVNRITPEMLAGAPEFSAVAERIGSLMADGILVAHNASFDLGFLRTEFTRCGSVFPERPAIDTVDLARRFFRFPSNRLGALAEQFGVAAPDAHRALGDCRTTRQVFAAIIGCIFPGDDPDIEALIAGDAAARRLLQGRPSTPLPASLAEMVANGGEFEIAYIDALGNTSRRAIRVRGVVCAAGYTYLVADCLLRRGGRSFRLDRIVDWKPLTLPT